MLPTPNLLDKTESDFSKTYTSPLNISYGLFHVIPCSAPHFYYFETPIAYEP